MWTALQTHHVSPRPRATEHQLDDVGGARTSSDALRRSRVTGPVDDQTAAQAVVRSSGDHDEEIMLANYGGGHTIDMEIREKGPRADGYFHLDSERTLSELRILNANTHYFLMWHSPSDWQDFSEEFLPAAQKAGIDVWAYIVPPSECHSDGWCSRPYGTDYVAWAEKIAELSVEFDRLKGWVIDDFVNGDNQETFTTECMRQILKATNGINRHLKLETVAYYGGGAIDGAFYEKYAPYIDGIVFPYRDEPHHTTLRSSTLPQQLDAVTSCSEKYDLDTNLLLYTGRYGPSTPPRPAMSRIWWTRGSRMHEQERSRGSSPTGHLISGARPSHPRTRPCTGTVGLLSTSSGGRRRRPRVRVADHHDRPDGRAVHAELLDPQPVLRRGGRGRALRRGPDQ